MITIAGRVASADDELSIDAFERSSVPDGLKEQRWNPLVVARRAITALYQRGISHVRLVIRSCCVFAIPAGGEK